MKKSESIVFLIVVLTLIMITVVPVIYADLPPPPPAPGTSSTTSAPSDTTAPTVSITEPTAGTLVAGTVTISASASDNTAVTKVEFFADGVLKATDTQSPYSISWDTTNGGTHGCSGSHTHALSAKAYDAAGNVGTSPTLSVNMNNPPSCTSTTTPTSSSLPPPPPAPGTGTSGTTSSTSSSSTSSTGTTSSLPPPPPAPGSDTSGTTSSTSSSSTSSTGTSSSGTTSSGEGGSASSGGGSSSVSSGCGEQCRNDSSRTANGPVPGTYDDWGLGGTTPSQPAAQPGAPAAPSPPQYTPPAYRTPESVGEESSPLQLLLILSWALNLVLVISLIWRIVAERRDAGKSDATDSIQQYISDGLRQGYSIDQLQQILLNSGWSREQVQKAIMTIQKFNLR